MSKDITIIGAGLVGSLCALYMAKRGYRVSIYERRKDLRSEIITAGKSINLALSERGWTALRRVGIEEEVKSPSNNNEQEKASNWSPITPETTTAFSEIED